MNKNLKYIVVIFVIVIVYYCLQYASSAVHYNCQIIKDDCPPPIYGAMEIIYRLMVQPAWLDQFEVDPMVFSSRDGKFSFWTGEVNGKPVVIRIREGDSPVMKWIEQGLPLGVPIHPANGEHIRQWLEDHPESELIGLQ